MSLAEHIEARAQTARTIAEQLAPDFLVVMCEERNEAYVTGHRSLETVEGATQLVRVVADRAKQAGVPGMKVGAAPARGRSIITSSSSSWRTTPTISFSPPT